MANITGKYNLANFGIYPYCKAEFHLSAVDTDADAAYIPDAVSVVIGSDGSIDAELWENDNGSRGTVYTNHVVVYADSSYQREVKRINMGKIAVVGDAEIQDLLVTNVVPSTQENALALAQAAAASAADDADRADAAADRAEAAAAAAALVDPDNFQPKDATLTSIAALGTAPGKIAYTTGVDTWAEAEITAAGRALLDDADAAAQRTTLGLGAAATAGFLDEDNFASNSATAAPSQQSTKEYVNTAILTKLNASGDAPTYACRAWVNFNGATGAIRAAGNVSSITKNGTGDYTVNFATAMPSANYALCGSAREDAASNTANFSTGVYWTTAQTASAARVFLSNNVTTGSVDSSQVHVAIFH